VSLFDRQKIVLLATFLLMVLSLRNALYPAEQWLQHTPTVLMLLGLLWSTGNARLSPIAFSCAISFIALHIIGARWIYSNVPYDAWWESLTGSSLSKQFDWQRNHYDRLVHFASGCFGVPVAFDWLKQTWDASHPKVSLPKRWGWFLSLCVVMAVGAAYEVLEWQIAMLFSPDQAEAYNGQQGDLWDAQKDLCLAGIGGLAAIGIHWIWSEMHRD
jgi:putative membrane protein